MSFFVEADQLLAQVTYQKGTENIFAEPIPKPIFNNKNITLYIVNSGLVSGAWEFFSYTLKHFDRATIIGQDTMGFGYFTKRVFVDEQVSIDIPYATTKHPISQNNW